MTLFCVFLSSFLISLLLIPLTIRIGRRFNILKPAKNPTGKQCIGGAGIYAAFLAGVLTSLFFIRLPAVKLIAIIGSSLIIIIDASGFNPRITSAAVVPAALPPIIR